MLNSPAFGKPVCWEYLGKICFGTLEELLSAGYSFKSMFGFVPLGDGASEATISTTSHHQMQKSALHTANNIDMQPQEAPTLSASATAARCRSESDPELFASLDVS